MPVNYTTGNAETDRKLFERYDALVEGIRAYAPNFDEERLDAAFEFAAKAHASTLRKDGSPYITHPLEVAIILTDMSMDLDTIIAALLHDVLEDTGYTYKDIVSAFGETVARMIDGVTKLTRITSYSKEEEQMENLRKMFMAMAKDIRVLFIKICDRLHNMRTIEYHTERKRREKSLETMQVYAPLAHRLGMSKLKTELEDLALRCLDPIAYKEITDELDVRVGHNDDFLLAVSAVIATRVGDSGIDAHIDSRIKQIYSIYKKMFSQHKAIFEIYDLYAVRVIVKDTVDCFTVLGLVHELYHPMPGRFKDYISTPKPNMYQSLHTTVIGREGIPFEIQIRTWDMHHVAEYGIAAHWKYKDGVKEFSMDERLNWVRLLLESQQDADAEEFIKNLRVEMFVDEVFVFTPKGDVINLPAGANPIDFAYAIHSAVGNRMTGAKVNGRIVALDYQLQNGDIVEVLSQNSHGPTRDWLKMVKTSEARSKIKQWFKREKREENVQQGKIEFEAELKRSGISAALLGQEDIKQQLLRKLSFATLDDLYGAIGYGGITALRAVNRINDELIRMNRIQSEKNIVERVISNIKHHQPNSSGVIIEGLDNCLIKFARCCAPVPGDGITGFVTKGYGVSIHREDCSNAAEVKEKDRGRWVRAEWANDEKSTYSSGLRITCKDRDGLAIDVATAVAGLKIPLPSFSAKVTDDGEGLITLVARVHDRTELNELINRIRRINSVQEVMRHGN
ncbi:MAG: bifunctional (p)ppGpp synthetase/guanosine-3',5'-bis(diphosphate) 3'-pyrophosphohydrolase [Oscillospiraceae bacterium]|nr:bifunctional (p)ppGpp synthetase/guanosine-3',5'-bis(diphosphate) 3'-pyrophosphohydrolase [Oscillospiraceae bacterium]